MAFKHRTLFVIGAGASSEVGMPVGRDLSEIIQKDTYLDQDNIRRPASETNTLLKWLTFHYRDEPAFRKRISALVQLNTGIYLAGSIDNYIDMHSENPCISEVGKLAITNAISRAEANSHLFVSTNDEKLNLKKNGIGNSWLDSFARILFEKVRRENLNQLANNVSIVCFNYDRCIEFYLIEAIHQTFGVDYAEAHSIVSSIEIVHPYGTLGPLPDSRYSGATGTTPYGHNAETGLDPWPVCDMLKTYTEQVEDEVVLHRIRNAVENSEQIIFLGFAFHPQNMDLLTLPYTTTRKRVYATGIGVSPQEAPEVKMRLASLFCGAESPDDWVEDIQIEHGTSCADLLKLHWRNLSSG